MQSHDRRGAFETKNIPTKSWNVRGSGGIVILCTMVDLENLVGLVAFAKIIYDKIDKI